MTPSPRSGSICLDVINQTWSPMYELVNIFETFLPQLLTYPNPADPLNPEAANLLNENPTEYAKKVKSLVKEHACPKTELETTPQTPKTPTLTPTTSANPNIDAPPVSNFQAQANAMPVEALPQQHCVHTTAGPMDLEDVLSNKSDLSSLSETSDICEEHFS